MITLVRPTAVDPQRAFRAVLDALARPGTVTALPVPDGLPAPLVPLLALADLDTPFCLIGAAGAVGGGPDGEAGGARDERVPGGGHLDGDRWTAEVARVTSAPPAALPAARLVAALRPITLAELGDLRPGHPAAPEDAALVALGVSALTGGPRLALRGPGVAPNTWLTVDGLPAGWIAARRANTFPTGADLLLIDPDGGCVGLPRSTTVED